MSVSHPPIPRIVEHLRAIADLLESSATHDRHAALNGTCRCLTDRARLLAARGWPPGTTGPGHGSDTTTTVERAAGLNGDDGPLTPPPFAGLDDTLAKHLRLLWITGLQIQSITATIDVHDPDCDPIPAGQGPCQDGCGHVCQPRKNPDDRLRAGFAPSCHRAWLRWRAANPWGTRSDFIRQRKGQVA